MLLNDVGTLLTAVQFQLSLYDGCRPVSPNLVNCYSTQISSLFNIIQELMDWGLEILLIQGTGTEHFSGTFLFFKQTDFVKCHGTQLSSLFTIIQELMAP